MKIVCFLREESRGGVEHRVIRYANAFFDRGHCVVLITLYWTEVKTYASLALNSFKGTVIRFRSSVLENQNVLIRRLRDCIADQHGDVLWINGDPHSYQAASIVIPRPPIVYHVAGDSQHYQRLLDRYWPVTSLVVAHNFHIKSSASKKIGAMRDGLVPEVRYIDLGIDPIGVKKASSDHSKLRLCYFGRIDNGIKNVMAIIPLASGLRAKKIPFVFHVVGDGPTMNALNGALNSASLADLFHLHGYLPPAEAHRVLSKCDILVHPSRTEGCPNAVVEAMAIGIVPLVGKADWVNTVIDEGRTGFSFSLERPEEAAVIAESLYKDRLRLREVSMHCQRIAQERFQLDRSVDAYLEAFVWAKAHPNTNPVNINPNQGKLLDRPFIPNWATLLIRRLRHRNLSHEK